jgi:transcriptional regulator with XRE-family HTH domain
VSILNVKYFKIFNFNIKKGVINIKDFTETIIEISKERKIPLTQICKDVGIATTSFQNWKNGSQPTLDKVVKILQYLNLSADEVLGLNNDNTLNINNLKNDLDDIQMIIDTGLELIIGNANDSNKVVELSNNIGKTINYTIQKIKSDYV